MYKWYNIDIYLKKIEKIIKGFISLDGIKIIKFHLDDLYDENEICHALRIYQNISVINEISESINIYIIIIFIVFIINNL